LDAAIVSNFTFATAALGEVEGVAETCRTPPAFITEVGEQHRTSRLAHKRIALLRFILDSQVSVILGIHRIGLGSAFRSIIERIARRQWIRMRPIALRF